VHEAAGRFGAALDRLQQLREDVAVTDPHWAAAQALLARCHRQRNEAGHAAAISAAALERVSEVPVQHRRGSYIVLAAELLAAHNMRGERAEANRLAELLEAALSVRVPYRLQELALWEIARTAIRRNDLRGAYVYAHRAYEAARRDGSAPSFAPAYRWASALLSSGDRAAGAKAVAILRSHRPPTAASPELSVAWKILLVRCRILAGHTNEALQDCHHLMFDAADAPPRLQALARSTLGEALAANGDIEGAVAELAAVTAILESGTIGDTSGDLARHISDVMATVAAYEKAVSATEQTAGHVAGVAGRHQQTTWYSLPTSVSGVGPRMQYL
jgi:hypothetical protein